MDILNRNITFQILVRYLFILFWIITIILVINSWNNCPTKVSEKFWYNVVDVIKPDWPLAIIIITLIIVSLFRFNISNLLDRVLEGYGFKFAPMKQISSPIKNEIIDGLSDSNGLLNEEEAFLKSNEFISSTIENIKALPRLHNTSDAEKIELLTLYLAVDKVNIICEKAYSQLYGSQLIMLRYLSSNNFVPRSQLEAFFQEAKKLHSSFYASVDLNMYLKLVIDYGIVFYDISNQTYKITELGKLFLMWLDKIGYTQQKPY